MSKTRIRLRKFLVTVLALTLIFPFQAFAEKKLDPVMNLNFADVQPLMMGRYQVILDNTQAYFDANRGQSNTQAATVDMNSLLVELANINSSDSNIMSLRSILASFVQAQSQMAVATNSMVQGTNISAMGLQTEQGNYTIVWSMESLYITYNNLTQQIEDMKVKKPLLEKQLAAANLQKQLGMTTDSGVLSTENALKELETGIKQLEEAKLAIKQTFNVNLAQPYDTDIKIGDVPKVTKEQISVIKIDDDYTEALKKAYGVRIQDSNNDIDKKNDEIRKFQNSFYQTHETLLDKQSALEVEKGKMSVAETNKKIADIKLKLGMISYIQYANEISTYATRKAAFAQAENALFQAYHQYQWAKKGLIVSSGSSGAPSGM